MGALPISGTTLWCVMIYNGKAKVKVYKTYIVAYVDNQLTEYYRSLIPKALYVNGQRYQAHITIIRADVEPVPDKASIYDGKYINYQYDSTIFTCGTYYWLNAHSKDIEDIREDLGLPRIKYDTFHITIGNCKNEYKIH